MPEDFALDEAELKVKNPQRLIWMLVTEAFDRLWAENPKLHNIGGLVTSIKKYGFKPPPQYDATLDAIVDGNGRTEALAWMANNGDELPDGLAIHEQTGLWAMPILVVNDAKSVAFARAYAVDANNLTVDGGEFTVWDMARMWDESYTDLLKSLGEADELPLTVDGDDLDALLQVQQPPTSLATLAEQYEPPGEREFWPIVKLQVSPETMEEYKSLMRKMPREGEAEKFAYLLSMVDISLVEDGVLN